MGISYPGGASNSFAYNGDDLRMQKVDSAGTANYLCDGTTPASAVLTDSSAVYTPGLSEHRGSTSKFYHGDNLGSTRGITNSSQTVTDTLLYDAFGNTISRTGTTPTPFGFVGKGQYQTDNDSGLMLLGYRYYDASVGRFISSDPAKAGDNWYAYCDNNPLNTTDRSGLDPDEGAQAGGGQTSPPAGSKPVPKPSRPPLGDQIIQIINGAIRNLPWPFKQLVIPIHTTQQPSAGGGGGAGKPPAGAGGSTKPPASASGNGSAQPPAASSGSGTAGSAGGKPVYLPGGTDFLSVRW